MAAEIELTNLPIASAVQRSVTPEQRLQLALDGGDDYELCFTVPAGHETAISELAVALDLPLTRIGTITTGEQYVTGTQRLLFYVLP